MERKRLTEDQIKNICEIVVKKSFKRIKKIISDQLDIICPGNESHIHSSDFINVVILSLVSLDINMIMSAINAHKSQSGIYPNVEKIFALYLENLMENLERQRQLIENEKMN